jgi:ribosomal protein S18 acetylase RimI-like enzyme
MDGHSLSEAHYTVLQNSTLVELYMERHKNIVRLENPRQSDSWITKFHMANFGGWLQTLLINDATVGYELSMLVKKPSSTILTFQGYEINGNTFYTIAQDKRAPTKIVVSALMQQTTMGQRTHIMVT